MIIFDDGLGQLGPMTDLRASFEVRTGMLTTAGRIACTWPETLAGYWVLPHLAAVVGERADAPVNRLPSLGRKAVVLCVNGRWSIPDPAVTLRAGEVVREEGTDHVVAAALHQDDAEAFLSTGHLPDGIKCTSVGVDALYQYPWDVLNRLDRAITRDIASVRLLDAKLPGDEAVVSGQFPVQVHRSAKLYPNVVLDAEHGPIAVHERAVIRPGAVLCGPCSIGRDTTILDHALIRPNTVIGPVCKVGGEVGGTVFQGYSNKSHDGHLGDSWVGKWVNFGAGTTNSNLLNTYGEINMRLATEAPVHRTGRRFVGAFVGDHVKTAICTRINTGAVVGTGSMIATTKPPPAVVAPFTWLTDRGPQVFRFEKFLETAATMMARRDKVPSQAYIAALRALHKKEKGVKVEEKRRASR